MKKIVTLLVVIALCFFLFAQKDVYLQINHKLETADFAFNQTASNNLDQDFTVTRLQYYVSEITLTYDGGQTMVIPNKWILVDASVQVNEFLDSININTLEKVGFGIGVEAAVNHNDPALWPAGHPLSLGSPSMHWGWNSGYRFVAMEGKCGNAVSEIFEIHALEDVNYFTQEITTAGTDVDGDLIISLDADYAEALRGINVSSALINHGGAMEAADLLINFKNHVFKAGPVVTTSLTNLNLEVANVYPNPIANNTALIIENIDADKVVISDLAGRIITSTLITNNVLNVDLSNGSYMAIFYNKNAPIAYNKLVVAK